MKFLIALCSATALLVSAVPHVHRTDEYSNTHGDKSATSAATDASAGGGCPCGARPFDPNQDDPATVFPYGASKCTMLNCAAEAFCEVPCSDTHGANSEGRNDNEHTDHYLGKIHKACRFNNDASCHSCPTTSCQYQFGNFYGSGYPCINLEAHQTFALPDGSSLDFDATDSTGSGLSITLDAYGNSEDIHFCDSDFVAIHNYADKCADNTIATIVSPKTCTHCQVVRCIAIDVAHVYADFQPAVTPSQGIKSDWVIAPAPLKLTTSAHCYDHTGNPVPCA